MKKALLVVGHGSKSRDAVEVFNEIVGAVKAKGHFDLVAGAHMELSEPVIETAVAELAKEKPDVIIIAPYFLYEGMHIKHDIPEIIGALSEKYREIRFTIARPIGFEPVMADIILNRAETALLGLARE